MAGKYNTTEIEKILDSAISLGQALEQIVAVSKGSGASIVSKVKLAISLVTLLPTLPALKGVNFTELQNEAAELDADEQLALVTRAKARLILDDKSLQAGIDNILQIVFNASSVVGQLIVVIEGFLAVLHPAPKA